MALGKTLALKQSLRDPGGQTGESVTPCHLPEQLPVPNPHGLLQQLFRDSQLLRKPTAPIEGDCR